MVNTDSKIAAPQAPSAPEASSHGEALKSTSVIGGSALIMILVRMVRTKVLTLILGPVGVGFEAFYNNILDIARMVASLGTSSSGVRQIAAAAATRDEEAVAVTVFTLRRITWVLGLVGAVVLFLLRKPIAVLTFGDAEHAMDVGILSLALVLMALNGGQGALLQGMRRIGDLARMGVIGIVLGTVVSIPIVWKFGVPGIVWYIVIGAANMVLMSWYYARRIRVQRVSVPFRRIVTEGWSMLKLGLLLTWSALLSLGTMYLLQVLVRQQYDVAGAGQFSAANRLSMVYVGFILQAMQTDFYPRLTGVATDNARSNRMVNEQVEVSLLLALPGILVTLAFAPWIIWLAYSSEFEMATEILCWQMAGILLRVISSPLGMFLIARGANRAFFWTECASAAAYLGFSWIGLKYFQLPGVGMAFTAAYLFYWLMILVVTGKLSGFRWSGVNVRFSLLGAVAVALVMLAHFYLSPLWSTVVGGVLAALVGLYCLKMLVGLVGAEKIRNRLKKMGLPFPWPKALDQPSKPQ